jgi:3-oxoacyl-[acyl-carrier-protein] synthase II
MYGHRVVVTGLGTVNPIGLSVEEYWRNLLRCTSGVGPITQFDASPYSVRIAAEVKGFDPEQHMDRKAARRMSRFAQFSVAAARQAIEDAGLRIDEDNAFDVGAIVATGGGGVGECEVETEVLLTRGPERVNPLFVPAMISNMASCQVSIQFGIKGPVATNIAACAAGIYSFYEALHFLRRGDAQAIVTGGTESAIVPLAFISLGRIGALSKRNDDPQHASRPFDRDRDGFVFGEGAGMMVLETLEHARRRGAQIYAELVGASVTADAYHVSAPEPSGASAARAMRKALQDAELTPADLDYLCAHGTGTPLNDATETKAIKLALGEDAYRVPISSPKSMIGHLLGAAGAMSALTCVLAIDRAVVPPTANLDEPDPECDLDYVPYTPRERPVDVAMANGFGFGGQNSVVVFRRPRD